MDRVEQAVVRQCLRRLVAKPGESPTQYQIGDHKVVAGQLTAAGSGIEERDADNYLYTRSVRSEIWDSISEAALDILFADKEKAIPYFRNYNTDVLQLLLTIFQKRRGMSVSAPSPSAAAARMFQNWVRPPRAGYIALKSGLYQVFRRYKPTRQQKLDPNSGYDWNQPGKHAIICELWYIDLGTMECKMVTGDLNVYHGSLCITHEEILYAILQRPFPNGIDIHQRFIASKLERSQFDMYSGILMKVGNLSIRPLAADMFFAFVPKDHHKELYKAFQPIAKQEWDDMSPIAKDSIIADYVAITPPNEPRSDPDWARVKYLHDFPVLEKMGTPTPSYIELFREPLRTLGTDTLNTVIVNNVRQSATKSGEDAS